MDSVNEEYLSEYEREWRKAFKKIIAREREYEKQCRSGPYREVFEKWAAEVEREIKAHARATAEENILEKMYAGIEASRRNGNELTPGDIDEFVGESMDGMFLVYIKKWDREKGG